MTYQLCGSVPQYTKTSTDYSCDSQTEIDCMSQSLADLNVEVRPGAILSYSTLTDGPCYTSAEDLSTDSRCIETDYLDFKIPAFRTHVEKSKTIRKYTVETDIKTTPHGKNYFHGSIF